MKRCGPIGGVTSVDLRPRIKQQDSHVNAATPVNSGVQWRFETIAEFDVNLALEEPFRGLAPALGRRVIQMRLSTIIRLNFFAVIVARIVPVVEQIVEDAER